MTFKYKVSALDFIDKDINDDSFKKTYKRLYHLYEKYSNNKHQIWLITLNTAIEAMMCACHLMIFCISKPQAPLISYGWSEKNFIKEFYGTIASVQEQDEKTQRFFASHKSFLVNIDNICDYDKKTKEIIFYEGRRCPFLG